MDNHGRYIEQNREAHRILGYTIEELRKLKIKDTLHPSSIREGIAHFSEVFEKGNAVSDLLHVHKDGSERWLNVNAVKISEGKIVGFILDITKQKQT